MQAEFNGFLNADCDQADGGAGANPVVIGVVARRVQALDDGSGQHRDRDQGRNGHQQTAFGKQFEIVVVRVRHPELHQLPLVEQHRVLVGVDTGTRDREVADEAPAVVPHSQPTLEVGRIGEPPFQVADAPPARACQQYGAQKERDPDAYRAADPPPMGQQPHEAQRRTGKAEDARSRHRPHQRNRHDEDGHRDQDDSIRRGRGQPAETLAPAGLNAIERGLDAAAECADREARRHQHPSGEMIAVDERSEPVRIIVLLRVPESVDETVVVLAGVHAEQRQRYREQHHIARQRAQIGPRQQRREAGQIKAQRRQSQQGGERRRRID